MKTVNPIYSFVLLLLITLGVSSCSEEPGYNIQDAIDIEQKEEIKNDKTKVYKKAAPKKRTSGFKAAPKKRDRTLRLAPDSPKSGPRVIVQDIPEVKEP